MSENEDVNAALRSLKGQHAINMRWAAEPDRTAATAPARAGKLRRMEDRVDPDRVLPPEERAKRVKNLQKAEMAKVTAARLRKQAGLTA